MTVYEIPLTPEPQTFSISIAGTVYKLAFTWNRFGGFWVLDIANAQGASLLGGLPLLPGRDLLDQFAYLALGFQLFCLTDHDPDAAPTYTNLGLTSHVYVSL